MSEADPLVVRKLEFLGGLSATGGFTPSGELPEVAFVGRSNVGKSSLLNTLVRRRKMARVSRTPGRTREINFFLVNDAFILSDLPGYGYARVSASTRAAWRPLMERYLRNSKALRGVVVLLDVRRDPSEDDRFMLELLADIGTPVLIAVTKVDKLSRRSAAERVRAIASGIGVDESQMLPFSAHSGEGRDELASAVMQLVRTGGEEE